MSFCRSYCNKPFQYWFMASWDICCIRRLTFSWHLIPISRELNKLITLYQSCRRPPRHFQITSPPGTIYSTMCSISSTFGCRKKPSRQSGTAWPGWTLRLLVILQRWQAHWMPLKALGSVQKMILNLLIVGRMEEWKFSYVQWNGFFFISSSSSLESSGWPFHKHWKP